MSVCQKEKECTVYTGEGEREIDEKSRDVCVL